MKKYLAIIAISTLAVACGSSETTESKVDEAAATVEAVADSAKDVIDSTAAATVDTLKAKVDSVKSN